MRTSVVYTVSNMIFKLFIFSIGITVSSCDLSNDANPDYITTCFKAVDDVTNSPLNSVNLNLKLRSSSGISFSYSGMTNNSGECCFEYASRLSNVSLSASKSGYIYVCEGPVTSTIRLKPVPYIQFHIKNVPPIDNYDRISITYPNETCFNVIKTILYEGPNVDVKVTGTSRINSFISWTSRHNDISSDSTINITLTSYDTTLIQIFY